MLKKIKGVVKRLLLWLLLLSVVLGYISFNLKSHSVYYAQYTPHKKGTEPVLMMLIDNLEDIYTPDDLKTIGYDFDGKPAILTYDKNGKQLGYLSTFNLDGTRGYRFINKNLGFEFNNKFKLLSAFDSDRGYKDLDIKNFNEQDIKKDIYKSVQPLIDAQSKPWINLQWLFDIVYHDKFN
ncbi:hypothetical protein [Atopobium sp. oral taxon 810]|uniref:hypothetical protein n=1 Tax=Atopobium sp. oral taxon 810 TaxID=712158 RepID=UPI000397BACF|nr:hypothetical protein [Atopobium sp. oral taxon 810]ERI06003.1 hypothetical protein HMPREF9069_00524 [Atopobium sp. oral taxon 810 str. F0209]